MNDPHPLSKFLGSWKGDELKESIEEKEMNFQEALEEMRNGKKVRRKSWSNKDYHLGEHPCFECESDISYEDAIAYDWEIIE